MKLNHSLIRNKKRILHEYLDSLEEFYHKKIVSLENAHGVLMDYQREMIDDYRKIKSYRHDPFRNNCPTVENLHEYAKSLRENIEDFLEEKNTFIIVILAWYDADIAIINVHRNQKHSGEKVYTRDDVTMGVQVDIIGKLEMLKKIYPLKKYFNNGEFYFDAELGVTYTCKPLHSVYWNSLSVDLDCRNFIAAHLMPS